jgi:Sulfatase-modifying factor enzyme 1/KAP family P-loop domain
MAEVTKRIRILGDQPWKKMKSPSFQFDAYASTLADIALNPENETPLCVLVQGEWGVGKSTLMETIKGQFKEELNTEEEGKRITKSVWFNAWKYKDAAPVMAGLLGSLLKEIGQGGLKEEFLEQFLKNRGRIAKAVIYAFPAMLDKILTDGAIKEQIEKCSTNIDNILSKCDEIDVFQQAFLEVACAWLMNKWGDTSGMDIDDKGYCLAVFIDDLDRCEEGQIKTVLEAIKLFLDFPGVCFYLAMDQHQLDKYLKDVFQERSKDALDKFVQVIFNIPAPPHDDFQVYVEGLLDGHPLSDQIHENDRDILALNLPANPRAAKRYLNDLAVWFSIFENVSKNLNEEEKNSLLPYAGRYHLLSHAVQKRDRARWNAKAGSGEVLLGWLQSLKEKAGSEMEGEKDIDFRLANNKELMSIVEWMIDPSNEPKKNLDFIVGFRAKLLEPSTPSASGHRIDPLTWVQIPGRDYKMLAYPVTQGLYFEVMGINPSGFAGEEKGDHPVETVSWFDAVKFCNKLSKKLKLAEVYKIDEENEQVEKLPSKKGVRLPTEEEWEHACRAGTTGDRYGEIEEIAWFEDNSEGATHPVGLKKPNALGLYDMLGNVWEWCSDRYDKEESDRVLRGGSWFDDPYFVHASDRHFKRSDLRDDNVGFRISRD